MSDILGHSGDEVASLLYLPSRLSCLGEHKAQILKTPLSYPRSHFGCRRTASQTQSYPPEVWLGPGIFPTPGAGPSYAA
jgi:hypothetical protein